MHYALKCAFGAAGQIVVGSLFVIATTVQTVYVLRWSFPPSNTWIFVVSMEALFFASYAIIATGFAAMWLDRRTPGVEGE